MDDARLRITTLRAAAGPAIELLEYLAPRDGRPFPRDARANDLVHWHTIVATQSPEAIHRALVRDPDGHALQFRAR